MKNLLSTTGVFVVVILLVLSCPCRAQQTRFSTQRAHGGRTSRVAPVPSAPFTSDYLEKSRVIFHAHQILYGHLMELHGQFPNQNRDESFDLCKVLNYLKNNRNFNVNSLPPNLKTNFPKFDHFHHIYHMRTEVSHQSYSVACFDTDRTVLITVAKYLDGVRSGITRNSNSFTSAGTSFRSSLRTTAEPRRRASSFSSLSTGNVANNIEQQIISALGNGGTSGRNNNQCSRPASVTYVCP